MSASKQAVAALGIALSQLVPASLERLSALRVEHPHTVLLQPTTVFNQLNPLVSTSEVRQAFGLPAEGEDQLRIRNLCIESSSNELRKLVYLAAPPPDNAQLAQQLPDDVLTRIVDTLDTILSLDLNGLIDPTLPLSVVEEVLELNTVRVCSQLFGYIESRVKQLTLGLHPTKGKGLVLLRLCNELLRRLSKPSQKDTVFAGRILSLLAAVFPLGERSGVNLRGDFNVDNKTTIEETGPGPESADKQGEDEATEDDATTSAEDGKTAAEADDDKDAALKPNDEMYQLFWKMQRFFSNPPLLMGLQDSSAQSSRTGTPAVGTDEDQHQQVSEEDPAPEGAKGAMAEFRISTKKILALFEAVAKREKELAGAAAAEGAKNGSSNPNDKVKQPQITGYLAGQDISPIDPGQKRKRYEPDVVDGVPTKSAKVQDDEEMQEPDSNRPDLPLKEQDKDNFFPKYLTGRKLLEYEIRDTSFRRHVLVQYLILFQYLLSFTPAAREKWKDWKNKTLQGLFILSEADTQWIRSVWRDILALLREIPPNGKVFLETILETLKRETNWIRWKTDSCPSIEKPPLTAEQMEAFASARALLLKPPMPYPYPLGTAALSELWQDGFPPPVPGTRKTEDELGNEVQVATDGMEELEFLPPIPSLKHYHSMIKRQDMQLQMRRRQLGIDPEGPGDKAKEDGDEKIQSILETRQSLAWRALRVASSEYLHLFKEMKGPENIEALMKAIDDEENPKPKPGEPTKVEVASSDAKPINGEVKKENESRKADEETAAPVPVSVPATPAPVKTEETPQPEEMAASEDKADPAQEATTGTPSQPAAPEADEPRNVPQAEEAVDDVEMAEAEPKAD